MSVFSSPCVPMPDSMEYEEFFDFIRGLPAGPSLPQMSMQQPPQQPLFDNPDDSNCDQTEPSLVVKREQETGFLNTWGHLSLDQIQTEEMDRYSPEEKKRVVKLCVREELHCHLRLKLMKEGKEFSSEAEDQPTSKDYPISEETRELQRVRKVKNREAAKKCRQKKKASEREQNQKLHESQKEVRELQQKLAESKREYKGLLEHFHNMPCFLAFLKENRHLVHSPELRPVLQSFVQTYGGVMNGVRAASVNCCLEAACRPVQQQPGGFGIEQ